MQIRTVLGVDIDLDKYVQSFPLSDLAKMFPNANIIGFEWAEVKEDLHDDFNLGVREGGTPEASDSLGADLKLNGWKTESLPPIIDENGTWIDGRTRRSEIRQLKNFEGWLPVLRIRMKQSEKPNTKRRATGIKSNFHDYVERTKMKDFVVAVVADIQCGECASDVDSIYQHLYDEYELHKWFDTDSGIDTKIVNMILKKIAGGTLVKEMSRKDVVDWLGNKFVQDQDKGLNDVLLAVGGSRDEQLFLRWILAYAGQTQNVILYSTDAFEGDAKENLRKFLKQTKKYAENAFKFVGHSFTPKMPLEYDGELPFNLKGIVPTIENDMQKKAFEKGQLITKEEFLK